MSDSLTLIYFRQGEPGHVEIMAMRGDASVVKSVSWERAMEMATMLLNEAHDAKRAVRNLEARVRAAREV